MKKYLEFWRYCKKRMNVKEKWRVVSLEEKKNEELLLLLFIFIIYFYYLLLLYIYYLFLKKQANGKMAFPHLPGLN